MGDVEIYNAIKSVCPEYLDEFKRISDLEIEVNKSFNKRLMAVSEALHADWDTKSIIKKLRLFVYNVPYGQSLPVNEKTAYMCEDWKTKPPPGYLLRIQGVVLNGSAQFPIKFSQFFTKIQIFIGNETLEWDSVTHERSLVGPCDGIEVICEGEEESEARIVLYPVARTSTYTLSNILSQLVGTSEATLAGCIRLIFNYAVRRLLLDPKRPGIISTDNMLRLIFGEDVQTFNVSDLRTMLKPHLLPPRPIELVHKVKLFHTEWIETERSYDVLVEVPNAFQDFSQLLSQHKLHKMAPKANLQSTSTSTSDNPSDPVPHGVLGALNVPAFAAEQQRRIEELNEKIKKTTVKFLQHSARSTAYKRVVQAYEKDGNLHKVIDVLFNTQTFGPTGQLGSDFANHLSNLSFSENLTRDVKHVELYKEPWTGAAVNAYLEVIYGRKNLNASVVRGAGNDGSIALWPAPANPLVSIGEKETGERSGENEDVEMENTEMEGKV